MSDTPRTDEVLDMYFHARGTMLAKLAKELEREQTEMLRDIALADTALRQCMNYIMQQPTYARNQIDMDSEVATLETAHVAITKLQPYLK